MTVPTIPAPRMLPLGTSQPPDDRHAVSVSLPTWVSVPGRPLGYKWVIEKMQANYPRDAARRCVAYLQEHYPADFQTDIVHFLCSPDGHGSSAWSQFYAVLYDTKAQEEADHFWSIFGDGLSSRHAEFLLRLWPDMSSSPCDELAETGTNGCIQTREVDDGDETAKMEIRNRIARLIAPQGPHGPRPSARDVFLYAKGMCAIAAVARALLPGDDCKDNSSEAVVFGWPYSETPRCVSQTGYDRYTLYSQGTTSELDQLEQSFASGRRIRVLFCEIPTNPLLRTPDLHRIRALADKYEFIVVCDETLGTFTNVDILPYADIAITSLTKIFNGAGNAMGGSAVVNPASRHYRQLHAKLSAIYEDNLFPGDAAVLASNSRDFDARVRVCNSNALALATFLTTQPAIASVLYPPFLPTGNLYERYRRVDGGYGYVLSVVFKDPKEAVQFYDRLDMCKGPSVGTNFSLALPYAQLAHVFELDWAEEQGIPRHIVRFSVGLEREADLIECVERALRG
ncbi:uncharacterized protein DSM5745_02077 [Aspergillus mulundensis]|uniref:Cystathionine gamma-synthase n=1 Tax=Aspergillus mulundensis TaxID=1810919 RepID=A0A3D8SVF9_9EURO|nr:hypothetical protein DSM5745_02077 [Aspergillus mulundensis]RDW90302.1 hypothetical protein DSM5745_02077 [Aspergillus mulundensis]